MIQTKRYNQTIIFIVIVIISLLLTTSYIITQKQIDDIKQKQYKDISENTQSSLNKMIKNKQQLTSFIALALAQNRTIIKALKEKNNNLIDIKYLSSLIDKKSSYKNLWYQVIDKEGNSFFRSWTKKTGDSLLGARPEVSAMINTPKMLTTISTGKFAMTFKSMVPIFDSNKNFLGIFEVISHFDSIVNQLAKEDKVFSVFLVNKTYKHQITKPLTNLFIDDYYITNDNTDKKIIKLLQTKGVEFFLDKNKAYAVHNDCGYLISIYQIPDINGHDMGYSLIFKPLEKIATVKTIYMKNNSALILFILVLLTVFIGYYLIYRKHQHQLVNQYKKHQEDVIKNTKFQTIGKMAAGITHEINTPLTYMKGTLEMSKLDLEDLPDSKTKKQLQEDYETIYNGVNRLGIIVESMKEMAQSTISEKEKFNVYQTLIIVLRMIHNKSKQIAPIYINGELFTLENSDLNKEKYFSNIHVQRIEQVWTIILNNALDELLKIKEYDQRRIDINIFTLNDKLLIKFTDNAGGIPKKLIKKVFEPFVSTKQSSGIGIGLNVAKKIIDEHNASISVKNTEDGACFTVILDYIS